MKTTLTTLLGSLLMLINTAAAAFDCKPRDALNYYPTAYATAQWVAKVEVIAPARESDGPHVSGPAVIAAVAVKYLHRYDNALPLALFDAPLTLNLSGKLADFAIGTEWLVFVKGSANAGWSAYSTCGEDTINAAWENNPHPANTYVARLPHSNRQHGVYENQGQNYQLSFVAPKADTANPSLPLTRVGWFAIPSSAAPATAAQDAALLKVDLRPQDGVHKPVGQLEVPAQPVPVHNQGAALSLGLTSDQQRLQFKFHAPLPAGYYRLVTSSPQLLAPFTAEGSSFRFQVKRSAATQQTITLNRLQGTDLHDQTCHTPHSNRAAFEGQSKSGDSSAAHANLLVHARMVSAAGEPNTPSAMTQLGKITVLNWFYSGAKPKLEDLAREGIAMPPTPNGFYPLSVGAQLVGKTLTLHPSFAELRIPQGAEFIAFAVPNHTPSDGWASRSIRPGEPNLDPRKAYPKPNPTKPSVKGEGDVAAPPALDHQRPNDKVRNEIVAQYVDGKATLYNHACYAWVLVKDGMLQWRDAPPEPIAAYLKHRQARFSPQWQNRLTSGIGNFTTLYTSWSQHALELDLAGWEGEGAAPFAKEPARSGK